MNQNTLCISIPLELNRFEKPGKIVPFPLQFAVKQNFGIKIVKKPDGEVNYTAFYSDTGELIKKCYYKGSYIAQIEHFRSERIFSREVFEEEKLKIKTYFTKNEKVKSEILYEYKKDNLVSIKKLQDGVLYEVLYGYDELKRINSRTLKINNVIINEQRYRFDILDRLVEFTDSNQKVTIMQMSPENQLIYYKITDKIGNEISVINNFDSSGYKNTELCLNGHRISISDNIYVDNIMLKKPHASEDDLDLIISNLLNDSIKADAATKRSDIMDIAGQIIQENIQTRALPISIRKRVLYNMSLNAS